MKFSVTIALLLGSAVAQKGGRGKGGGGGASSAPVPGTLVSGPMKSAYWADSSLPRHTMFGPSDVPEGKKLPIMVWGNGACSGNGTFFRRSLWEAASHGIFVIANGDPNGGGGGTKYTMQIEALNWIDKNAGQGKYAYLDKTRIAAAGQSCGGLETYQVGRDPRIKTIGIFNSGEFTDAASMQTTPKVNKPIFYFLGGPSDIAYKNGERDYKNLKGVARWKGNLPVGHMATWSQTNGGKFGKAEWMWMDWMLRGNQKSSDYFLKGGAKADGWDVVMADMNKIVTPPPI